jgi:hypothetical protein
LQQPIAVEVLSTHNAPGITTPSDPGVGDPLVPN